MTDTMANFDILVQAGRAPTLYHVAAFYHLPHPTLRQTTSQRTGRGFYQSAPEAGGASLRAAAEMQLDPTGSPWGAWLRHLAASGAAMDSPGRALLHAVGEELFTCVFQDEIERLWVQASDDLDRNAISGLRMRLLLEPPEIALLPWELLREPRRGRYLGSQIPLVRLLNRRDWVGRERSLSVSLPVRLLIVAPQVRQKDFDLPDRGLNAEAEIVAIQAAAKRSEVHLHVQVSRDPLEAAELDQLLRAERPHIVHVIAHGRLRQGERAQVELAPRQTQACVDQDQLREIVETHTSIKFVFLNVCHVGQVSARQPFVGLAPALLSAGVPAVLAMQYRIRDDIAGVMGREFYVELVAGTAPGSVEMATATARRAAFMGWPDNSAGAAPVLYLNAGAGRIFELPAAESGQGVGVNGKSRLPADGFDLSHRDVREWLRTHHYLGIEELERELAAYKERLRIVRFNLDHWRRQAAQLDQHTPAYVAYALQESEDNERELQRKIAWLTRTLKELRSQEWRA